MFKKNLTMLANIKNAFNVIKDFIFWTNDVKSISHIQDTFIYQRFDSFFAKKHEIWKSQIINKQKKSKELAWNLDI